MARNKYPEETVSRILDAAMRLFREKGFEHTTIPVSYTHLSRALRALPRFPPG